MDVPRKGPQKIGNLLSQVLARRGLTNLTARLSLEEAWKQVADPALLPHCTLGGIRRGVLEILVDNASLHYELENFRKQDLLQCLQEKLRPSTIRDLCFRRS